MLQDKLAILLLCNLLDSGQLSSALEGQGIVLRSPLTAGKAVAPFSIKGLNSGQ